MTATLKFFWNGIKDNGGKLQKCFYSEGCYTNFPEGTITIYAREYSRFSGAVREQFKVENDSDAMTDYFEQDRIRVTPDHPLYGQVKAACDARTARYEKKQSKAA